MAIVTLKKMSLCGLINEKRPILEQLQTLGGAHLIPLTPQAADATGSRQIQTEMTINALRYLNRSANKRHQVQNQPDFDARAIVKRVLAVQEDYQRLSAERDFLQDRIEQIKPWGDFKLAELGGLKLWFYIVPKRLMRKISPTLTYQVVAKDNIYCFVVVLSETEPDTIDLPVPRTHTGKIPLSQLQQNLQQLELQLEDLLAERESLTRWISLLALTLYTTADAEALNTAKSMTFDTDAVFVVQAWIPENKVNDYLRFAEQRHLAIMIDEPDIADRPPTLLHNHPALAGGEEITTFYQTPGYFDWDPSPMVFCSFALFFAMILSDAGYACIFLLLLALKWRRLGRSQTGLRLRLLAASTLTVAIVWGVFCGSYFGYSPPVSSWLAKAKLLDLNNFNDMMILSITIGVVHLMGACLIKAWQKRTQTIAWSSLGWSIAIGSGFSLWWCWLRQTESGITASYTGLATAGVLILFFSGENPLHNVRDVFRRLLAGIKQLSAITKMFGDVLSYMRLFALGLASASLAMTFNQLATQVSHSVPGAGLLLSLLILLFGHSLNLALCVMSGVVHGLRLNFIEFYNWSVSDEGYPFKAFSKHGEQ